MCGDISGLRVTLDARRAQPTFRPTEFQVQISDRYEGDTGASTATIVVQVTITHYSHADQRHKRIWILVGLLH
jgi:hypothetical protein